MKYYNFIFDQCIHVTNHCMVFITMHIVIFYRSLKISLILDYNIDIIYLNAL